MSSPKSLENIQALVFDLMGTCTDWHTSIVTAMRKQPLPEPLTQPDLSAVATEWRAGFFQAIFASFNAGEQSPNIDIVHARVLDDILEQRGVTSEIWDQNVRSDLIQAWHNQQPWSDSVQGLRRLKEKFMIVVLANGTTRLQIDIVRSAGLPFHAVFSSQILQSTKPEPEIYTKALKLLDLDPSEVAMVAAHAYDLRAANKIGMKTIYIRRTTEDPHEDMEAIKAAVDVYIDSNGLLELANCLKA